MVRPSDFSDPEYDRQLAEFKAMKAQMQKERGVKPKSDANTSASPSLRSPSTSASTTKSTGSNFRRQI